MIERKPDSIESACDEESLVDVLRTRRHQTPDRLAYQFLVDGQTEGTRLTYRQLDAASRAIAARLGEMGEHGDRALLLYPPGHEFLLAFFGCMRAGIIAVPLPPPDAARIKRALPRLQSVIRDAKASLVLTTNAIEESIRSHFDGSHDLHELSWINTEAVRSDGSWASGNGDGWEPSAEDIAFLQYTSGSTSTPKGVMVSHGNVLQQCQALTATAGYDDESVTCTWMPYHHDYGLVEGLIAPMFVGAPCYFMSPLAFIKRPIRWLEAISKYRVTHSQAPNFAYDLCTKKITAAQREKLDLRSWTVAAIGAEPIRPQTLQTFFETFKRCGLRWETLAPAYGLAEATLVVTHCPAGMGPTLLRADVESYEQGKLTEGRGVNTRSLASCGHVLRGTQVEIVNPQTRQRCDEDCVGEIWVAGPSIAQGYWNRPDETERYFHARLADSEEGPFLRTGDLGCLRDGQLYVTGRLKDLIVIRGLNHYPQDIEQTVEASLPALRIGNGAAFSLDVNGDEELVIVYEVQGKYLRTLDAETALSAIREAVFNEHDLQAHSIALWKPGQVPKTTSGKIQRRAVKAAFLADDGNEIARWYASAARSNTTPVTPPPTTDSARQWITAWLAEKQSVPASSIDPGAKFADLGVDSLLAADLASDMEQWLGARVDPTLFWNLKTISALATHLGGQDDDRVDDATSVVNERYSQSQPGAQLDSIAIVGMGCRFPGKADSPDEYWRLLHEGAEAIGEIPRDRWNVEAHYDPDRNAAGKMYTRHGGFIENIDGFDASFFGITPREAADLDPQHRLLLEVAWESLEHACIAPSSLRDSETGVFVGLSSDDHAAIQRKNFAEIDAYKTLGSARSFAAGRVAYLLGLHGPVVQLDTACSSSLVAVYQACQSLQTGECNLAIAGGVNLMLSPATMIALCKLSALAPDGHCKTFDAAADGYVRGEGCGIVILKRMEDAIREGDTILATIRSASVNHDGASNGLTAPNGRAQEQLLRKTLHKARLAGRQISYVESHGTGTELGDPIELTAIDAIYDQNRTVDQPLYVGSVKPNIGHLEAAAGIAGLIKVVLMLQHRKIPPQRNFETPNPHVPWEDMALEVPTKLKPWPDADSRGIAAVSSFGVSGTNAHVILEAAPTPRLDGPLPDVSASSEGENPAITMHLLALSAQSERSLQELAGRYAEHIVANPQQTVADICFTASTCRDHFKHRLAVIASSRGELLGKLRGFASDHDTSQVVLGSPNSSHATPGMGVGFLFTGQGTQYVGMGRELYESQPVFRDAMDRCSQRLREQLDLSLTDCLYGQDQSPSNWMDQAAITQPALFALQHALAELWKSWGITPTAVIGHSSGEYAAACIAGVFSVEAGLEMVANRGRLIDGLSQSGMMVVVMADEARVRSAIEPFEAKVSIAAINGPEIIVISGHQEEVGQILTKLRADGIDCERLQTSNAGHSALVDPMLEPFAEVTERFHYSPPRLAMVSNVSGKLARNDVASGAYWVKHVREPVRFTDGMRAFAATGCRSFVEIGPNPNLLAMGMACLKGLRPRPIWLPSLSKDRSSWESMLYSLGKLYAAGTDIAWVHFHQPYHRKRVTLPTYAFERQTQPVERIDREPGADQQVRSPLPDPQHVAATLDHSRVGLEEESRALTLRLDEIAIRFVIDAFADLGFPWRYGAIISQRELEQRVPQPNRPKVMRVLRRLVERGLLKEDEGRYHVQSTPPDGDAREMLNALSREADYPECDLMRRAGAALAPIWKGEIDPLTVLFPDGTTEQAVAFYRHSRLLAKYNEMAGEVIREAVNRLPPNASLRVLEVGAGTGGLTTFLLPQLPAERSDYVFTDLSPLFLRDARTRFDPFPFLKTKLLDISKPPGDQGFDANSFDLLVAANVLHATPRLHETLGHVQQLLKPGGWLMLLEGANPPLWGDVVFTLIDGWWCFEDRELRPDYPLMRRDRWVKTLGEARFTDVSWLNDSSFQDDSQNTLYLARANMTEPSRPAVSHPAISHPEERISDPQPVASERGDMPTQVATGRGVDQELIAVIRQHAATVMRLKPDDIEWSQPLSELGLDSLMATELRAHIGKFLGLELPLNTLQMRRSVEEIAAYVSERAWENADESTPIDSRLPDLEVDTPRAHLIPLQPNGDKTPLFFVPAGYGDLFAFQEISHAIGTHQPVYGLQPASAKRVKTFRQMSIYRLVSAYIAEIEKVQPDGPYLLSGYSAGAIIAVELARELMRQGKEIGLLVIFDPPSHVPFWLDAFYQANYRVCSATGLMHVMGHLRSRVTRRLFHTLLDEGLRTHTSITRNHRVAPYPGRITYFRARLSQSSLVSMRPVGRFWKRTAQGGSEVHWIPGTHYGMLRGSGASVVVDELRDCLQRAAVSHPLADRKAEGEIQ